MAKPTYANGDIYCARCKAWVYKEEIPLKTHYSKNGGSAYYHNICGIKMRLGGRRSPEENKEAARKQRLEYSNYGTIWLSDYSHKKKCGVIKRDILTDLDKWESLVKPSYQYEENNNLVDYSYSSNDTNVPSPIAAINIGTDPRKRPSRNAATIIKRYSDRIRAT